MHFLLERTVALPLCVRRHKLNKRLWIRVLVLLRARHPGEPSVLLDCQGTVMYFTFDDRRLVNVTRSAWMVPLKRPPMVSSCAAMVPSAWAPSEIPDNGSVKLAFDAT